MMQLWQDAVECCDAVLTWSMARAVWAAVMAAASSLLSLIGSLTHPSVPFLIGLVCLDFALAASIALWENRFTLSGFKRGLAKFLGYAMIFMVTSLADNGMGIAGWVLNLTVGLSCYAIAGEAMSCLLHIDHIFPGRLPVWVLERLLTFRLSMERPRRDWKAADWGARAPGAEAAEAPEPEHKEEQ